MKTLPIILLFLICQNLHADFSATANLRSSYVWHGQPLSDSAIIDGSLDYEHESGLSAGIWASSYAAVNKDPNTDPSQDLETETANEIDYYVGYDYELTEDLSMGLLYTFMSYTTPAFTDYDEIQFHIEFKNMTLSHAFYSHFDGIKVEGKAHYTQASYEKNWDESTTSTIHVGYTNIEKRIAIGYQSYLDYMIGLYRNVDSFKVGIEYTDTNRKDYSELSVEGHDLKDQRVTFLISRVF